MYENDEEGKGWLSIRILKVSLDPEEDLSLGSRILGTMMGTGLLILEPIVRIKDKICD